MKRIGNLALLSVLAGFCIGLGGTVFLRVKDTFPGANVVGALLFAIGLFVICTRGYVLYTGKVCYLFDNKPSYALDCLLIWLGNLVGCILISVILRATTVCGGENGIDIIAGRLVDLKLNSSYISLFLLAILCNIFIFIAVNGYANNPHELGKYLALFLGVSIFILCGTEHSIADMYYFAVSGRLFEQPGESFIRLVVISLGNIVGGVFFPLCERLSAKLKSN